MTVEERCGNPYLADKTWLYQRSVVDGLTAQEIAQQAGAAFQDTRRALMTAGIPHRVRDYYASTLGKRLTADTILTAVRQSTSIEQAAEALQVNPITLRKHAERKGLTWEAVKAAIGVGLEPTRDMLAEAADEMTTPELSAHFGITVKRTRQLLAQHGLKARPNPFSMRASEVEEAVRRYEVDGESINVIAEALGYGPTSVYRALKRRGVATSWRRVIKSTRTLEPPRPLVTPVTQPRHEPPPGVHPSEHLMEQMGIGVRAANALARGGARDASDLTAWGVEDVSDLRCVGPTILNQIVTACQRLGIELQPEATGSVSPTAIPDLPRLKPPAALVDRRTFNPDRKGLEELARVLSVQQIAEQFGVSTPTVYKRLHEYGIALRWHVRTPGRRKFNPDRKSLEELARVLTVRQIADKFGVTKRTVYARLHEHDIALPGHDARSRSANLAPSGRRVRVACRGCETYVWRDRAVAAQGPSWCSKACQERNETP